MRTVKSILNELDGIEFQANIAVINGLNHLIAVIDNDPMLVELQEAAINDSKAFSPNSKQPTSKTGRTI